MRVVVYGLWHLGCVTAACAAEAGHDVVGVDPDPRLVEGLRNGRPPIEEPGLSELIAAGQRAGKLRFTTDAAEALRGASVLWVAFDTPMGERDQADVAFVRGRLEDVKNAVERGTLVLVSSQVPVGFARSLADDWSDRGVHVANSPENVRLGSALDTFRNPERVIVGLASPKQDRERILGLFASIRGKSAPPPIEWMSLESAEMTKHALNAFLATSVTFMNEVARMCEAVGADAKDVERGLKSEGRVGQRAYLAPGAAFAGGTLARDIRYLADFGQKHKIPTSLFSGILASNENHKDWARQKVALLLDGVKEPTVAVLGLTYKPNTSTLRRSVAIELCQWMQKQGIRVRVHDPMVRELPPELRNGGELAQTPAEALRGADLAVIATDWPAYRALSADEVVRAMRTPRVIDPSWVAADVLSNDPRITYVATGRGAEAVKPPAAASISTAAVDPTPLLGRRAIITGANRGLGLEIAKAFIEAGASVLLTARDEALLRESVQPLRPLARHDGQRVLAMGGDVSDVAFCQAAVARLRDELPAGRATVLVNNAGVLGPTGLLEDGDWTQWSDTVRINLFGTALMCRAILPLLRAEGYGKVINLSGGGATAPMPRFSAYAASKAGVVRLTETMAHELAGTRVDANAIAPGALNTRMLEDVLKAGPDKVGKAYYERSLKQRDEGGAPPAKAAALAVFLASAASDGITGRLISAVWDDWADLPQHRDALAKSDIYTLRRIIPEDRPGKM